MDDPLRLGRVECGACRAWFPPTLIITAMFRGHEDRRCLCCWPTMARRMDQDREDRAKLVMNPRADAPTS